MKIKAINFQSTLEGSAILVQKVIDAALLELGINALYHSSQMTTTYNPKTGLFNTLLLIFYTTN